MTSHDQPGHDDHVHDDHVHDEASPDVQAALDLEVADGDLSPSQLSRRAVFRAAGILGSAAGLTQLGAMPSAADPRADSHTRPVRHWLAGDHHTHTQYSNDGLYRVIDQARHAAAYGLDWLVITDHGGQTHARIGVEKVNPDIRAARQALSDTLIFQGLEWNIPAAEHGTVFVAPGRHEVEVLRQFETDYDGEVNGAVESSAANEALAVAGIQWLGRQVDRRRVADALFVANHPARNGIDSPHEIRAWRDADPRIAIGFEGAPGRQAAGLPSDRGPGAARGYYGQAPGPRSFPGYPTESYRTWGGFDWMTATVGGMWDSLLAEGKPWWITANSDSHVNWADTAFWPEGTSVEQFDRDGRYGDPVHGATVHLIAGDFWPGFYSRTHVGATDRDYRSVMQGLRSGRVWVDHGSLVKAVDVQVRERGQRSGSPLGAVATPRRGRPLELVVRITAQDLPNWAQFVPRLSRVDVVRGSVSTTPLADPDTFLAPDTRVVRQWDTSGRTGTFELVLPLGPAEEPFYLRLRGTDGKRSQPGFRGAEVDPQGPAVDVPGDADPWTDLWFYTNPIWVMPR